jgi:hypothetical protein
VAGSQRLGATMSISWLHTDTSRLNGAAPTGRSSSVQGYAAAAGKASMDRLTFSPRTIHVYWIYCAVLLVVSDSLLFMFISTKIRLVATNFDACETNSIRLQYMLCTCSVFAGQFQYD